MSQSRSPLSWITGGVLFALAVAFWYARSPHAEPPPVAADVQKAALQRQGRLTGRPATEANPPETAGDSEAGESPAANADPLEEKRRIAAEGERARIAARERAFAELDWNAPRPGPPALREPAVGKREAALTVADKRDQTEQMVTVLQQRVAHTRERIRKAQANRLGNAREAQLLTRLESRVTELEQIAQGLREPVLPAHE